MNTSTSTITKFEESSFAGPLSDLWRQYEEESRRQLLRIARVRKSLLRDGHSPKGGNAYLARVRLALLYKQLEELRETERHLRCYYRFSDEARAA
ncbi:MAG: hypothetical protein LBQ80_03330 [Clostridium sp.]|jgi:hypothetical protein|nr:hypothetical protein [Clostridium sp.]